MPHSVHLKHVLCHVWNERKEGKNVELQTEKNQRNCWECNIIIAICCFWLLVCRWGWWCWCCCLCSLLRLVSQIGAMQLKTLGQAKHKKRSQRYFHTIPLNRNLCVHIYIFSPKLIGSLAKGNEKAVKELRKNRINSDCFLSTTEFLWFYVHNFSKTTFISFLLTKEHHVRFNITKMFLVHFCFQNNGRYYFKRLGFLFWHKTPKSTPTDSNFFVYLKVSQSAMKVKNTKIS